MLRNKATVVVLFALIGTSCIEAWQDMDGDDEVFDNEDLLDILRAKPSMPHAITIQKNNVYNTHPSNYDIYGSIVQYIKREYLPNDLSKPIREQTATFVEPGGLEGNQMYLYRSGTGEMDTVEAIPSQQTYGTLYQDLHSNYQEPYSNYDDRYSNYQEPYPNYQPAYQEPYGYEPIAQQRYPTYYPNQ